MYLVTGGAGFIGSNLVAGLAEQGLGPIVVCDMLGTDQKWRNLARHPVHQIVEPEDLLDFVDAFSEDLTAIFHMGAISTTTETDVDLIMRTNLTLSQALWQLAIDAELPFIYASSAATYGDGALGFVDDNDPAALAGLRPLNPYGWSKQLFDNYAIAEAEAGSAPPFWAGLKFFNVYGPNEYHKGGQRSVAHQLFEQIEANGSAKLFKSHHPDYEDGGQLRDFVWVEDCVELMLWLLHQRPESGVYNCGTGQARSFKDLALACFAAMGRNPEIDYIDTPQAIRQHYQYFTEADMSRVRAAGFNGGFTSLEEGVASYIKDYLSGTNPYR